MSSPPPAPPITIAPSILSADFARLAEELARIEAGGADLVHVDVMDGHFVPNLTLGPPVVAALRKVSKLPLDCHLMIENADRVIDDYAAAGAARISVHVEACPHLHRTLQAIKQRGLLAGVALNPATPPEALSEVLADLDQVLVMSVNPGFGGQKFIPESVAKVARVADMIATCGSRAVIEVDGGVGLGNVRDLVRAGASVFVAGNSVFGTPDAAAAVRALRAAAQGGA